MAQGGGGGLRSSAWFWLFIPDNSIKSPVLESCTKGVLGGPSGTQRRGGMGKGQGMKEGVGVQHSEEWDASHNPAPLAAGHLQPVCAPWPLTLGVSSPLHWCHLATPTSPPAGHIPVPAHHGESPEGGGRAQLWGRGASPLPLSSLGHLSPSSSRLLLGLWLPGTSWKGQGSLKAPAAPMGAALQPHNTDKSFPCPDVHRAGHPGQMCRDHRGPQWPQPRWVRA